MPAFWRSVLGSIFVRRVRVDCQRVLGVEFGAISGIFVHSAFVHWAGIAVRRFGLRSSRLRLRPTAGIGHFQTVNRGEPQGKSFKCSIGANEPDPTRPAFDFGSVSLWTSALRLWGWRFGIGGVYELGRDFGAHVVGVVRAGRAFVGG
jgi:hypothetical protein